MQAISHVATALILKRAFPKAPMLGLIAGTEAVELLWVGLNLAGIERTELAQGLQSIADVHLVHMPFSHSVGISVILALITWAVLRWRGFGSIALAMGLAVLSHILLDLMVHARDIALFPGLPAVHGTGLYSDLPIGAFAVEVLWTLACWGIYQGSWRLLALIMGLQLAALPFFSTMLNTGEVMLTGQPMVFSLVIFVQILATMALLWAFTRHDQTDRPWPTLHPA